MLFVRTFSVKMNGAQLWLAVALLQALASTATCGSHHHRRSTGGQANHPLSKGGWRPVVGSGGLLYGSFGTAPLHAQAYKIPVPVLDVYQSSARPLVARDVAKVTSIAQSYRPTTLRTVPSSPPIQNANQPINSYHNPFALQNNGFNYKYVQNFPVDTSFFRNSHNQYAARPVSFKYQAKYKQPLQNNMLQQLTNIQPIHFGQYNVNKPYDLFGKPIESYARPDNKKQQSAGTEIFKPQVFELLDSDTASQSVSQQVKTAQQQSHVGTPKTPVVFPQYSFQDALFPSILGSFGSFGVQSVKGRDSVYPTTKTTYLPPPPTKQTIFNSFSYAPNYKSTPSIFSTTTPKLQTTANLVNFGSNYNDFKITPTQSTKLSTPYKIDPNAGSKGTFKPSPQDPFVKHYQSDFNKITTYNPTIQTTTLASNYFDYSFPSQQNAQIQNYFDQQTYNNNYENKKIKIHDSVAAGGNQQVTKQYTNPPKNFESGPQNSLHRPTYEVTETTESEDVITHSSPSWALTSQSYEYNNQQTTEEPTKKLDYTDSAFSKPSTTPLAELPEEYAIVTEAEKGYENSLGYDGQVESQSRRPLGDDFEPIGKHKLKDYYYRVSTPAYDNYSTSRRTKKPSEATRLTTQLESTTPSLINDIPIETLPTLPPNKHFKRPSLTESVDNKIRKRNKNRRRRPPLANVNRNRDEASTRASLPTTESTVTTDAREIYTIRPRVKTTQSNQASFTTPGVTTDLTTSALPTISPTAPTIVKKKLSPRRPLTTSSYRYETTTQPPKDYDSRDSQIMKIANRPHFPKLSSTPFEYKTAETPDYTHKQDEKDTPTSDISVSLSDSLQATSESEQDFSFHKDVKPIEAKLEPVTNTYRESTTDNDVSNEVTTVSSVETTTINGRQQRPRVINKYNNRSRFNVKDYRSRLSSTTSTTEKNIENTPKVRFPHRRVPNLDNENENTTERKRFTPKDPRHKINNTEGNETTEKEIHTFRPSSRQRQTTVEVNEGSTQKISSRIRNGQRKPRPTEETTETTSPTTVHSKRLLRKKVKDSELGESVQDISVTETTVNYDHKNDITSERTRSESAIMKIADKKHHDHVDNLYEHSKRVSDLTLAASKDYNKPGMFKTVATNSRRIPNYFTIATDDPILPIEAFFPQLNQKKES